MNRTVEEVEDADAEEKQNSVDLRLPTCAGDKKKPLEISEPH